MHSVI